MRKVKSIYAIIIRGYINNSVYNALCQKREDNWITGKIDGKGKTFWSCDSH